jgi:broad specificity phosphatase PhoE
MQPFPGRGVFFFLRHGETDWNLERRVMGRLEVPLNARGEWQVRSLAPHLRDVEIRAIWTSPLPRARATAEILAEVLGGLPIHEEAGLTEVDFGAWEGKTFAEIVTDPRYRSFLDDPLATPMPGGESLTEVRDRVYAAMARIGDSACGERIAVVSHGDPLRLLLAGCLGLELSEFRRLRIDNAGLSAVELTGDWTEVKFINMRPDLANLLATSRASARVSDREPIRKSSVAQDTPPDPRSKARQ